nr:MAG TPA: Cation-transporting ATPase [Caudoviricetes sp.]
MYWCCHGCNESDCAARCHNDRDRCNIATNSNVVSEAVQRRRMEAEDE